mgnify:CR=1 FL=1
MRRNFFAQIALFGLAGGLRRLHLLPEQTQLLLHLVDLLLLTKNRTAEFVKQIIGKGLPGFQFVYAGFHAASSCLYCVGDAPDPVIS